MSAESTYLVIKVTVNIVLKFWLHVVLVRIEDILATSYNHTISEQRNVIRQPFLY